MEQPHSRKGPLPKCAPGVAAASLWGYPLGSRSLPWSCPSADPLRLLSVQAVQRSSIFTVANDCYSPHSMSRK